MRKAPVRRGSGDFQFHDVRIIDYPFFIDVRRDAIGRHAISGSLPQVLASLGGYLDWRL